MILVTVDLIPHGNEAAKTTLHTIHIVNDGTGSDGSGDSEIGHYDVVLYTGGVLAHSGARVGHHRRHQRNGTLRLVERALSALEAVSK